MSEKALNMLGLMRKANAIEIGETNTGITVRADKAKLLILAKDSSANAKSRAKGFTYGKNVLTITLPFTKEEISSHVGVSGCSMAAITDIGFANALVKILNEEEPEKYELEAQRLEELNKKAQLRKAEARNHDKNKRTGKRRINK